MKSYLVTGGAGFIGSHLCDTLLAAGHRVLALDDLSTGHRENLAHHAGHPRLRCVYDSVCNRKALSPLVEEVDAVFHLAAVVGVRLVVESPVHTIETNVNGTQAVLELAAPRRVPVLIASTSEVYGKGVRVPFAEDDDLLIGATRIGRWSYACSKALDEFLALAYARERRLPVTIVRLFNTTGPRQTGRYGMVLPTFVRQALAGQPITVYGDGRQQRCFCSVSEVVDALAKLMEHPRARGRVFNIGSDEEVTIGQLAERVRSQAKADSEIVYLPYREVWDEQFEDMRRRIPDLTRIRNLIGFGPHTRLDAIIGTMIEHERSKANRSSPV